MASDAYHEPLDLLTEETRNMHRAIVSLMEELEAIDWREHDRAQPGRRHVSAIGQRWRTKSAKLEVIGFALLKRTAWSHMQTWPSKSDLATSRRKSPVCRATVRAATVIRAGLVSSALVVLLLVVPALADEKRAEVLPPPPRSLWITVNQDTSASTTGRSAEFTVETREDGVVERRRTLTLVGGAASSDRSETSSTSTEQLRVLEGHRAFVHMSRAVPVPSIGPVSSAGGTVLVSGKTYLDGDLAFSIVPRLADDQVTLEITATDDTVDNRGALDVKRALTTVSGRLGEWLNVGDAIRSASSPRSGILSADQRLSEVGTLLVRIEEAR